MLPVWLAVTLLPEQGGLRIKNTSVDTVAETIDIFKKMGFDPQRDIIGNDPKLPPVFLTDLPDDLRAVSDPDVRKAVFTPSCCRTCCLTNGSTPTGKGCSSFTSIRKNELCGPVIVDGLSKWQITAPGRWIRGHWESGYRTATPRDRPGGSGNRVGNFAVCTGRKCVVRPARPLGGRGYPGIGQCERRLKSFDTLQDSVRDYIRHNRNRAYRGFRAARAACSSQRPLDERELVGTLTILGEGEVYVETCGC